MNNSEMRLAIANKLNSIINDPHNTSLNIPNYTPNKNNKNILILSGGGIKGIAFLGAIQALIDLNILDNITTFAGTSIGSIIAILTLIGYTPSELFEFVKRFDLSKLKNFDFQAFLSSFGLDSGERIDQMLTKFFLRKKLQPTITFSQLFTITKKSIFITGANLSTKHVEYFSHISHGNMPVLLAVRISMSIPFIFKPVSYNDNLYVDGGCLDNYPIEQFTGKENKIIGLCVVDKLPDNKKICTIDDFIYNVIYCIINGNMLIAMKKYCNCTIEIPINNITPISFDIDENTKTQLFNDGYNSVRTFQFK